MSEMTKIPDRAMVRLLSLLLDDLVGRSEEHIEAVMDALNTPGGCSAFCSVIDGHEMATVTLHDSVGLLELLRVPAALIGMTLRDDEWVEVD